MTTQEKIQAKLPGEDTGITLHNTFCDICAPGPHCGVTCYVKDGKVIKVEGTDAHPTNHGKLCARGFPPETISIAKTAFKRRCAGSEKRATGNFSRSPGMKRWMRLQPG